jgi:hypothetical protein
MQYIVFNLTHTHRNATREIALNTDSSLTLRDQFFFSAVENIYKRNRMVGKRQGTKLKIMQ